MVFHVMIHPEASERARNLFPRIGDTPVAPATTQSRMEGRVVCTPVTNFLWIHSLSPPSAEFCIPLYVRCIFHRLTILLFRHGIPPHRLIGVVWEFG